MGNHLFSIKEEYCMKSLKCWIPVAATLAFILSILTPAMAMRNVRTLDQIIHLPLVLNRYRQEEIAFVGGPGSIDLWKVRPDGSGLLQLSSIYGNASSVSWSPDGSKILFVVDGSNTEIYTIDANGTNLHQLTNNTIDDWFPSYSPDGKKILFNARPDNDCEIYTMNPDGSSVTKMTDFATCPSGPRYSPDGSKIAFNSGAYNLGEIYIMNSDGSNIQQVTSNFFDDNLYEWSPDGTQLMITSNRFSDSDFVDAMVIDLSGNVVFTLTTDGNGFNGFWSPDGSKIVYSDNTPPDWNTYLIDSDGTDKTPLSCNGNWFLSWDMDWAPTGDRFAYPNSGGGGGFYIYNIITNSCDLVAQTGNTFEPHWNP
jgi:TolB protein